MEFDASVPLALDIALAILIIADFSGVIHAFRTRSVWLAVLWSIVIVCLPFVGIIAYCIFAFVAPSKRDTTD